MNDAHKSNAEDGILEELDNGAKDDEGKYISEPSSAPNTNTATAGTNALSVTTEESVSKNINHVQAEGETEVPHGSTTSVAVETTQRVMTRPADAAMSGGKKRLCRFPGCQRVIKSQGHCQRHGARAKRCRIPGCDKQAQGTHDGMCKRHWKQMHAPDDPDDGDPDPKDLKRKAPPAPIGESVYEHILPNSIAFRPSNALAAAASPGGLMPPPHKSTESSDALLPLEESEHEAQPQVPDGASANIMPLVQYLHLNAARPAGWHRHHERRAKGVHPVSSITAQLEPWERQLALVEILLLSGGTPYANFKDLSHAWGREKGFHMILANSVCERHGEVDRKRRSDAGRVAHDAKRTATAPPPNAVVTVAKDMAHEDDEDSTPGDAVTAMCNDEGAIGMMLLEEIPTTHTNGDTMAYGMTQV